MRSEECGVDFASNNNSIDNIIGADYTTNC